jgi:putative endonuclease
VALKRKKAKKKAKKTKKYKRMLEAMRTKEKKGAKKDYSVYILRCAGDTLYTGIAKDVLARLKAHRSGKGAAYTKSHLPVQLIYQEDGYTRSGALIREAQIKSFPPKKKRLLAASGTA